MNRELLSDAYVVIQSTQAPYSNAKAIEALEAAMAATNVGKRVYFMFTQEGVLQLQNNQQANVIEQKSLYKKVSALPLYDIEQIFVDKNAIEQYSINIENVPSQLKAHISIVEEAEIMLLNEHAQSVLVF